jgi:hypothetical protein
LFKVITNFKFYTVLSKKTFESISVLKDGVLCAKEIHRLGPMDLKIYTLAKNLRQNSISGTLGIKFIISIAVSGCIAGSG